MQFLVIQASGDIVKLEKPTIKYAVENPKPKGARLERPLRIGDYVEIKGKFMENSRFDINFIHDLISDSADTSVFS